MKRIVQITLFVLALSSCKTNDNQWNPNPPDAPELPTLVAELEFKSPGSPSVTVRGAVATTDEERALGLMFRKKRLADDETMLFVMNEDADHSFWMKNTYIPLDMVFVDTQGVIVGVLENVQPHTGSRSVGKPSRYVIELDGGWCKRHNIGAGDRVVFNIPKPGS